MNTEHSMDTYSCILILLNDIKSLIVCQMSQKQLGKTFKTLQILQL